jgi:hypothetical protein
MSTCNPYAQAAVFSSSVAYSYQHRLAGVFYSKSWVYLPTYVTYVFLYPFALGLLP